MASFPWFVFSPFVLFCGFTRFTRRPSQWLDLRQARGARRPPLARVRARGSPSEGGGLVPSCFGIWLPNFVGRGSQGPRAFLSGMGAFFVPPHRPFFTRTFFPRPRFFFFLRPSRPLRNAGELDATAADISWNYEHEFPELLREECLRKFPGTPRRTLGLSYCQVFFVGIRGKRCRFFSRIFSWRPSPFFLQFFRVLPA